MTIEDTQDVPLETDPARMAAKFDAALARAMDELTRQERTNASFVYSVCTDDDQAVCLDGILRLGDLVKAIINQ